MDSYTHIEKELNMLPQWYMESVITGGVGREAFIDRMVRKGISQAQVVVCLERIVAKSTGDIERLQAITIAEPKVDTIMHEAFEQHERVLELAKAHIIEIQVASGKSLDDAYAYEPTKVEHNQALKVVRHKHNLTTNKHEVMLGHINETLENAKHIYGRPDLTKTEILKACRKDKGEWRKAASEVLVFLTGRGMIMKVGSRYCHTTNKMRMVETDFTRKVFECLYVGPKSINGIVKHIGYDNVYGRKKVRQTLDFLVKEGLVITNNYRWAQNGVTS